MGDAKWTPGPWRIGMGGTSVGTTDSESSVAVCVAVGTRDVPEAEANARLIAAAPDMADILRQIAELTVKQQLPITAEIHELASKGYAQARGDAA